MTQAAKARKTKGKSENKGLAPIKTAGRGVKHVPNQQTRTLVMLSCASGWKQDEIARSLGIAEQTLRTHYAGELADGGNKLLLSIAGNLARIAQDPNHPKCVAAAIFWLKTKGGFREVDRPGELDGFSDRVTFTINIGGATAPKGPGPKVIDG